MKNFILLLVVIMTTITISAQKVNRFGQKVVKEIHIAYVSKKEKSYRKRSSSMIMTMS